MRVAVVCPYSLDVPGGVGTHALGEAGWLARQGIDVTLIAPGTRPVEASDAVRVELVGRAVPLPFNGSIARLAVAPAQARHARRLAAEADAVHVHEPLTPGIAHAVATRAANLVVTHHASFDVPPVLGAVLRRRARSLGPRRSLAVSEAARTTARAVTDQHVQVVPNAITMPPSPGTPDGWRGGRRPRVAFLGRADDLRKGFPDFMAIAADLADQADCVAVGPGTGEAPAPVSGHGVLSDAERLEFLQHCDVLVAPNRMGESFGLVLAEGLAAGCAVAASDLPGFNETIADAVGAGLAATFPAGDVPRAAAAVRSLLARGVDPAAAHDHARRWSWDHVGPSLLAALRLAGPVPGDP